MVDVENVQLLQTNILKGVAMYLNGKSLAYSVTGPGFSSQHGGGGGLRSLVQNKTRTL